jgi:hypothetical protein
LSAESLKVAALKKLKVVRSRAIKLGDWVRVSRWQEMTDQGIAKG